MTTTRPTPDDQLNFVYAKRIGLFSSGIWALLLLAAATSTSAASLLSTNLPPISPGLPEASFSVIRVFGALMLVLGLFLGGVWLLKNWQRLAIQRGRPSQLQIVEMKA